MTPRTKTKPRAKRTPSPAKRVARISRFHRQITVGLIVLSGILVLTIVYVALSEVKIYLSPATFTHEASFEVELLTDASSALAGTNILPGTITAGERKDARTVTIEQGIPMDDFAQGEVIIYNNYSRKQPLVKTTRLRAPDGKIYRLSETVVVPAGGTVTVRAAADQKGPAYDRGRTIFTIPGLWEGLQDKIYAETTKGFSGGQKNVKKVTKEMILKEATALIEELKQKITKEMKERDGETIVFFKEAAWNADVEPDASAEKFTINATLPFTVISFSRDDLHAIAENNLIATLPPDQQLVNVNLGTISYELLSLDDMSAATIKVKAEGKSIKRIRKQNLDIQNLKGKTKQELVEFLTSLPEIQDVQVIFSPFWLRKVPALRDHVFIQIMK